MLLISEKDVLQFLPMADAVRAVRQAMTALGKGTSQNQARRRLHMESGAVLHSLAGAHGAYFGTKVYSTHPDYGAHFAVLLYESATARPVALFEANHLGQIRTGAATGVATDLLAAPDAKTLCVIGSGFQAKTQLEAIACVRKLEDVRVWSRHADGREAFARKESKALSLPVRAAATAREAVEGAEIVVTATYAKEPVFDAAWLSPGVHVNLIGSNNPKRREGPKELIDMAAIIAVDSIEQARIESGDLLLAWTADDWSTPRLHELANLLNDGYTRGEPRATVFKSNGLGVQDVAVAAFVYERMAKAGAGKPLEFLYS
ncbi:MAG: ornithine cyclodeaminase family protein [Acidobacteriota bacterium]